MLVIVAMYQLSVSLKDTVEKERNYIKNAMKEAVTLGNAFHVISATWFEKWKLYVDFDNTSGSRKTDEVCIQCVILFLSHGFLRKLKY